VIRLARTAWARVKEPRVLRVLFLLGYVVTLIMGVTTLSTPPAIVEGELGPILSAAASVFLIVGGVAGAATVLQGWWQVERHAVAAAMLGIVIFGLALIASASTSTQLGALALGMLFFVLRLALIRGHDFEPRG
jgi:FtsH-binding integral membrane protein